MQGENQMKFLGLSPIADEMINRVGEAPCNQKLALGRKGSYQQFTSSCLRLWQAKRTRQISMQSKTLQARNYWGIWMYCRATLLWRWTEMPTWWCIATCLESTKSMNILGSEPFELKLTNSLTNQIQDRNERTCMHSFSLVSDGPQLTVSCIKEDSTVRR